MELIGQRLKEARIKLKLSIEEVSERTKIRPYILTALEENNFTILQPVYIKSFIKTYASFLKFPSSDIKEFIAEVFKEEKKQEEVDLITPRVTSEKIGVSHKIKPQIIKSKYFKKLNQQKIINYLIYSSLLISSLLIIYIAVFYDGSSGTGSIEYVEEKNSGDTAEIVSENKDLLSIFEKPDSLVLEAQAIDTAWLKIDIDGKINEPVLLVPGVYKRWSAVKYFNLTVGNVGAVKFLRNGKLLEPLGSKGSVIRNVKITADKIEVSSSPWQYTEQKKKEVKASNPKEVPRIEPSNIKTTPTIKSKADTQLRKPHY